MSEPSSPEESGSREREEQLDQVIAGYLEAIDAGQVPDQEEILRQNRGLAAELREFFESQLHVGHLARTTPAAMPGAFPQGEKRRFGGYDIIDEVGRGGMGVVYKARQAALNRTVALKVIIAGRLASPADRERFRLEAELSAALDHPHIVPVHEVGSDEGLSYFSMKFLEGGSLARLLSAGRIAPREAARLLETIARAVQYAHERGVLHRDLKPSNILLDSQGRPHVSDFGLARRIEAGGDLTRTGEIVGTPTYMAPEQLAGRRSAVTIAADVYSLGAILYETLTGRAPFASESSIETLRKVMEEEPEKPRSLESNIPSDLETIALKCLEKAPERRYANAAFLADDLRRHLRGEPILARRASYFEHAWRWARRNPAGATVVLLLVVLAAGSSVSALWLRKERNEALENLRLAYIAQARAGRGSLESGRRFDGLAALSEAAKIRPGIEVRNEAIACLTLADLKIEKKWNGFPPGTESLAFDADLKRYARGDAGGRVSVREVASDLEIANLHGLASPVTWLLFSPDGQHLAARHGPHDEEGIVTLWDLSRKEATDLPATVYRRAFDFSPDGRSIVLVSRRGNLIFAGVSTGKEERRLAIQEDVSNIHLDPRGEKAAVGFMTDVIHVHDLKGGGGPLKLSHPAPTYDFAWHPDGRRLAVSCEDRCIHIWDVDTGKEENILQGHESAVGGCSFSRDGESLVSSGSDGKVSLWDVASGRHIVLSYAGCRVPAFNADATLLAFGMKGPDVWIWGFARGREYCMLPRQSPYNGALDLSADGRILLSVGHDGVEMWDLDRQKGMGVLRIGDTDSAIFEPGSTSIITSGERGLLRWPIGTRDDGTQDTVVVGPSRAIGAPTPRRRAVLSADGKRVAAIDGWGGGYWNRVSIEDAGGAGEPVRVEHHDVWSLALSGDGRWLATGTFNGRDIKLWDGLSGAPEATFPARRAQVLFSPGDRWLLGSTASEYTLRETGGAWTVHLRIPREDPGEIPGAACFDNNGRMLAIARSMRVVELVDPETGDEIATLRAPEPIFFEWLRLGADSRRLMVSASTGVRVWDLGLIRQGLRGMALDWDDGLPAARELPPAGLKPLRLEVR